MKLTMSIDRDCKCMESYFHKLFDLMEKALVEERAPPMVAEDADADESQAPYHGFSHFIKPDMIMNVYSMMDFWLKAVCDHQQKKRNLTLTHRDIRGDNDLHGYFRYLTAYAGLDLNTVQDSYRHLDGLRKVRNRFIHNGGHVPSDKENEFSSLQGVSVFNSLINIEDEFVWSTLEHAKIFLFTAAMA